MDRITTRKGRGTERWDEASEKPGSLVRSAWALASSRRRRIRTPFLRSLGSSIRSFAIDAGTHIWEREETRLVVKGQHRICGKPNQLPNQSAHYSRDTNHIVRCRCTCVLKNKTKFLLCTAVSTIPKVVLEYNYFFIEIRTLLDPEASRLAVQHIEQ